jgi:hypothetical protein
MLACCAVLIEAEKCKTLVKTALHIGILAVCSLMYYVSVL